VLRTSRLTKTAPSSKSRTKSQWRHSRRAVQAALQKAAGTGQISIVESLTKKGTLVAYEATVKTGTKSSEIQVGPDGKKLAHEE
jgi:hypothetical protein